MLNDHILNTDEANVHNLTLLLQYCDYLSYSQFTFCFKKVCLFRISSKGSRVGSIRHEKQLPFKFFSSNNLFETNKLE